MTERRANARLLIDQHVPDATATDYCSSIHATSLTTTLGRAAPWFRMTAAEVIVGATLNAAYALRLEGDRGSLEVGKLADLAVLSKDYLTIPVSEIGGLESLLTMVGGRVVYAAGPYARFDQIQLAATH